MNPVKTRKFRNVRAGNRQVALVIDDLVSVKPWTVRGLRIYGNAELLVRQQGQFDRASTCGLRPPFRGAGT
jgi:pyridoxamine 5'-phosphate oxidase family protein